MDTTSFLPYVFSPEYKILKLAFLIHPFPFHIVSCNAIKSTLYFSISLLAIFPSLRIVLIFYVPISKMFRFHFSVRFLCFISCPVINPITPI